MMQLTKCQVITCEADAWLRAPHIKQNFTADCLGHGWKGEPHTNGRWGWRMIESS